MTTTLESLRTEAARHPAGSDAHRLLSWAEIHFADSAERIAELEEELSEKDAEAQGLRDALNLIKSIGAELSSYAGGAAFALRPDVFARDLAPFKNLMAFLQDPDYVKPKRTRKKKEAANESD